MVKQLHAGRRGSGPRNLSATSLNALYGHPLRRGKVAEDVGGVLILRDGQLNDGDAYVYYTGSYECSAGNWQGKITSQEHTPTGRPMAARVQHIGFLGTLQRCRCQGRCNGPPWRAKHSIRCNAALAGGRLNSISLGLSLQFDMDKPGRSGDFRY